MHEEPMGTALQYFKTSANNPDPNPKADPETFGAYPKEEEVSVAGRKNSDIILGDDDIRIRCGAKKVTDLDKGTCIFNADSPAYIKLKYHEKPIKITKKDGSGEDVESTATIVADRINLIGNKSQFQPCNRQNPDEFIDDDNMKNLIEKAHQIPYGDVLVHFLRMFRQALLYHTHKYSMLPTTVDPVFVQPVKDFDLNSMLSESIKIN
jgi:hypothetical protein